MDISLAPNMVPSIPDQTEESTYAEVTQLAVYKSSSSGLPVELVGIIDG